MNRIQLKFILLAFIVVVNSCGGDETTEPVQTGTITGHVFDAETSLPIASSNVTSDPPTSAVTTDTTGLYTILNVDPETYTISALKMGYIEGSANISVSAGNSTIADIFLIKDSTSIGL